MNPHGLPVPDELRTPAFLIRRQSLDHAAMDYEAVMDSKAVLREWSDSEWPEDGFTPDQNVDDLTGHLEDHAADAAYGFSILEPDGERLLGSLYLEPVAPFADAYEIDPPTRARLAGFDVRVEYWLRRGTPEETERAVARAVLAWLDEAWWLERPAFGSRRGMTARRRLYEAEGLVEAARIVSRDGTRIFRFHARPEDVASDAR